MTPSEAKQILMLYRPGSRDQEDPDVAAALAQLDRDPELRRWFENHCQFQQAVRDKFRQIHVPPLRLAAPKPGSNILKPIFHPGIWAAAAAAILLLLAILPGLLNRPRTPDQFADFRFRMVRTVLREYRMDLLTHDMNRLRQFLGEQGAPADYTIPAPLHPLELTGGGRLQWRNHPVSMVCFDRGDQQMLFLFVMDRNAVPEPPPSNPRMAEVNKLQTVSWSSSDRVYLLAGPDDSAVFKQFKQAGREL